MAITVTTLFSLSKHDRGDDWLATINTNWDDIDALLKDLTLATGLTGRLVIADNTGFAHKARNDGTGNDYESDGTSQFADIDCPLYRDASTIELRPDGVGSLLGLSLTVASSRLTFDTTQASGFAFLKAVKIEDLQYSQAGVTSTIATTTLDNIEFKGGATLTSIIRFVPTTGSAGDEKLEVTREGQDGVRLTAFGTTNSRLHLMGTNIIAEASKFTIDAMVLDGNVITGTAGMTLTATGALAGITFNGSTDGQVLMRPDSNFAAGILKVTAESATEVEIDAPGTLRITPDTGNLTEFLQIVRNGTSGVRITGTGSAFSFLQLGGSNITAKGGQLDVDNIVLDADGIQGTTKLRITPELANLTEFIEVIRQSATELELLGSGTTLRITPDNGNLTEFLKITRIGTLGVALESFESGVSGQLSILGDFVALDSRFDGTFAYLTETITSPGAASVTRTTTLINGGGAATEVVTLANGITGQIKIFVVKALNGTTTINITPTNFNGGASVSITVAGDGASMIFDGTNWNAHSIQGAVLI